MGGVMVTYVLVSVVALPFLAWALVSPRAMWWTLRAWQYKNPEAHEPSGTAYRFERFGAAFALVFLVGCGMIVAATEGDRERTRQWREYEACLEERDGRESLFTPEEWCEIWHPPPEE